MRSKSWILLVAVLCLVLIPFLLARFVRQSRIKDWRKNYFALEGAMV